MKYLSVIILFLCISCNRQKEIHILFENAGGLNKGSNVYMRGIQIGRVLSFILLVDSVEVIARIDKDIEIYKDAEIRIIGDIYGEKSIEINPGTSTELLAKDQKLYGQVIIQQPDTAALQEISSGIKNIFSGKSGKQDSILLELRRINKTLDSMNASD